MREAIETGLVLLAYEGSPIIRYQRACACDAVRLRRQFDAAMSLRRLLTGWRPWRQMARPLTDPAAHRKGVVQPATSFAPKGAVHHGCAHRAARSGCRSCAHTTE